MAKSGVSGDFRKLAKIVTAAGRVASKELVEKSLETLADVTYDLNNATLAAGTSPSGRRWKPTKKGDAPLSGARGRLRLKKGRGSFEFVLPSPYKFHQGGSFRGTYSIPARALLVARRRQIPKKWRASVMKRLDAEWFRQWPR